MASASPRRAQLLRQIGIPFKVVKGSYHEPEKIDENLLEDIALGKAKSVSAKYPQNFILGADTVVICEKRVLGKPKDEEEAQRMLQLLSGRVHRVITAVALVKGEREAVSREETLVWMRNIEEEEIKAYTALKSHMIKQLPMPSRAKVPFCRKGIGVFFNVVGLPIYRVVLMLKEWDMPVW